MLRKPFSSSFSLLTAWFILSLLRLVGLSLHYVFPDPFGATMVARIDRFLPFHALVECGALAQILLPFALLALWKPRLFAKAGWFAGAVYLVYGTFDLEILRFFRQHATLSYIGTYLRPQALFDSTTLMSLGSDPFGIVRAVLLGAVSVGASVWGARLTEPRRGSLLQPFVLTALSLGLGTSPLWLNHTTNRTERILPPTYVLVRDFAAIVLGEAEPVDEKLALSTLEQLRLRPFDSLTWSPTGFPLLSARLEHACSQGWTTAGCLVDGDGDGFDRQRDCDDRDPTTHPGARELPSDGIDQDCSGRDSLPVNIVILLVESLNRHAVLEELSKEDRLPNLKRLESYGGAWYLQGRSNGFPSVYGVASTFLGLWSHPHRNYFTSSTGNRLRGIPDYLPKTEFARLAFSGADPTFDNQMPWLRRWFDVVDFDPANGNAQADSIIVDQALRRLDSVGNNKPWFALVASHNMHMPFHTPEGWQSKLPAGDTDPERFARALDYFDHQLGRFLDHLAQRPDFQRTVFLVLGDHGFPILPRDMQRPEGMAGERTATMIGIFSPDTALKLPRGHLPKVASQTDIGPTVLGLLGIRAATHFQGRDLRDTASRGALYFKDGSWEYHTDTMSLFSAGPGSPVSRQLEDGTWHPWTDTAIQNAVDRISRLTTNRIWVDSVDGEAWRETPPRH